LAVGPSGTGKTSLTEAIAARLGRPLLRVEGGLAGVDPVGAVAEAVTEARVTGALLCFDDGELWFAHRMQGNRALPALLRALEGYGGLVVLTTSMEGMLDASILRRVLVRVDLGFPTPRQRGALWRSALPEGQARESLDLDFIAEKYEFTGAQIEAAAAMATAQAWTRAKREGAGLGLRAEDVEQAAKGQLQHHLAQLAVRTVTHLTLEDIVLPDDLKRILRSVLSAVRNRRRIFEEWGLGERVTTGQGLAMLFRGESGTGKTLSAEILASELAMPLYRIAIPKIVSKYIGETEKNLEKAFREAQVAGAMLLFDEADAIFTKRVEVNNANDRYSNMEVNLLLQELERFDGVVILTTNLDAAIDDAFERRLNYKLDFPFPDGASRALIWRRLLPPRAPIDLSEEHIQYLGEQFELSGGSIKNVMVRASYAAAEAGGKLDIDRLEGAAIQEYRELGKLVGGL
jgi:SpoVK/Ycf46/Vps4 family AAA+-type ATPase